MKVIKKININKIIFFDLETRSLFKELDEESQYFDAWEYDSRKDKIEDVQELKEHYASKAPLRAEYSAICCISVGYEAKDGTLRTKSYFGDDEKKIIIDFYTDFDIFLKNGFTHACTHAGNFFDIPFIARRSIVNGITIHPFFDVVEIPPWERKHLLDTKQLWGMNGMSVSLIALATCLGLPSPKQSLQGSEVNQAYWDGKIDLIVKYCEEGDVPTLYGIYKKFVTTKDYKEDTYKSVIDGFANGDDVTPLELTKEALGLKTKAEKDMYLEMVKIVSNA